MCDLYSLTKGSGRYPRAGPRHARRDGQPVPPLPGIFPDRMVPVVRAERDGGDREPAMLRRGFPPVAKAGARPVTNMRNLGRSHCRGWLRPEFRCVVPATSSCEHDERHDRRPTWFALGEGRPLFAFAGI